MRKSLISYEDVASELQGEKDTSDQKTQAELESAHRQGPSVSRAPDSNSNGPTLLTLPAELRRMILQNSLDRNHAGHVTVDWKPVSEQSRRGPTGGCILDDQYSYNRDPHEEEGKERSHEHNPRRTPYSIYQKYAQIPVIVRRHRLYPEVLYTCKQLFAEGTEIVERNDPKFIRVTTNWSIDTWHQRRTECRQFPVWTSCSKGESEADCLLHISCRLLDYGRREPQHTVLIAPQDLPHFMSYARLHTFTWDTEQSMGRDLRLAFPRGTSPTHWGFEDDDSLVRHLFESIRLYEPTTAWNFHLPARFPTTLGVDSFGLGGDLQTRLQRCMASMGGFLLQPDTGSGLAATSFRTTTPACPDLLRMLSQAEDLVPTASPMEISSSFHRLKYATYWTIREYRCWRERWPEDIWINRLAAVYAWCCWRLSTVADDAPAPPRRTRIADTDCAGLTSTPVRLWRCRRS